MPLLNTELAQFARDVITEMREEGWPEDDIFWSTCGGLLKQCEAKGTIGDDLMYDLAAIKVLVNQVMAEQEPTLQRCPYCQQLHEPHLIEQCPRKPKT